MRYTAYMLEFSVSPRARDEADGFDNTRLGSGEHFEREATDASNTTAATSREGMVKRAFWSEHGRPFAEPSPSRAASPLRVRDLDDSAERITKS